MLLIWKILAPNGKDGTDYKLLLSALTAVNKSSLQADDIEPDTRRKIYHVTEDCVTQAL